MVTTMYKKDSRNIYYIPADIVLKDKEYLAFDQGKVTCCCNVVGYNFEAVSGDPVLILEWVLYSPHGFNFSTIHEIDDELFELLESVRAITRFDGRVDLKVFYNYLQHVHYVLLLLLILLQFLYLYDVLLLGLSLRNSM